MDLKKHTKLIADKRIFQSSWIIPLSLLIITFTTFGLLAHRQGLYFDDWPAILVMHADIDLWEFYKFDRPFSAWTFLVFEPILGISPQNWQIFTIALRWVTAWGVYWILHQVWPSKRQEVFWMTIIFTVHPVFTQQSIAVAYSQHFVTYALYVLSVGAMLATLTTKRPAILILVSILATAGHMFTMEYFWGLELMRPILLWMVLARNSEGTRSERLKRLTKQWSPYVLVLLLAVFWRYFLVGSDIGSTNSLRLLSLIVADPINGLLQFVQTVFRDIIVILASAWYKTLQPSLVDLGSPSAIISWAVAGFVALAIYFFGNTIRSSKGLEQISNNSWEKEALLLGMYAIFVGMLPGWLVDREITIGMFSDRIALPAMIGAGIVFVSLVALIATNRQTQIILLSVSIGLAAGAHFRIANEFRWEWVEQRQFYWQMYWRAPALKENTAVLADGALFSYTGEYPTATALNVLYSARKGTGQQPYWFFEIDDNFYGEMSTLFDDMPIEYQLRTLEFAGKGHDNLVVWYDFPGSCVWVLTEVDALHPNIPEITKTALPISNLSRIVQDADSSIAPPESVFGPEPDHTWCYYFQKAQIAFHQQAWEEIVALGEMVELGDFEPNTDNKIEWYPFIEAYGRVRDWSQAETLSIDAYKGDQGVQAMFCKIWSDLEAETPASEARDEAFSNVVNFLGCGILP